MCIIYVYVYVCECACVHYTVAPVFDVMTVAKSIIDIREYKRGCNTLTDRSNPDHA